MSAALAAGDVAAPASPSDISDKTDTEVRVQGLLRANYGRLEFQLPAGASYGVTRAGEVLTVRVGQPVTAEVGHLIQQLPNYVLTASTRPHDSGLMIDLNLVPGAQIRHFREGDRMVLDIVTDRSVRRPAHPLKRSENSPAVPSDVVAAAPRKLIPASDALKGLPAPSAAVAAGKDNQDNHAPKAGKKNTPEAAGKEKPKLSLLAGPAGHPSAAPESALSGLVSVDVKRRDGGMQVQFNWRRKVRAAMFRRQGRVWVVFDQPVRIAIAAIELQAQPVISKIRQIPLEGAVGLRLDVDPAFAFNARRDGSIWTLEFTEGAQSAPSNILVPRALSGKKGSAHLVVDLHSPGHLIQVRDDVIGDVIDIVPLSAGGAGIWPGRATPEFQVLPSAQGVALIRKGDGVDINPYPNRLVIARLGGLALTTRVPDRPAGGTAPERPKLVIDFEPWVDSPEANFAQTLRALEGRVATTIARHKSAARLQLARYLVAHGFATEALGPLALALETTPGGKLGVRLHALNGIARFMAGHYREAHEEFSRPEVASLPLIEPFRAGLEAARLDWLAAEKGFALLEAYADRLPVPLRVPLLLTAAEAALAVADGQTAASRLARLANMPLRPRQRDQLAVLGGHLKQLEKDFISARRIWEAVIASGSRPSRARAGFALVRMQLATGEMARAEAIRRLDRLRFAWRDSTFEFDLLRELGHLHLAAGAHRKALEVLRRAVHTYRDVKGAKELEDQMRVVFADLFGAHSSNQLPPFTAIATFHEYRALMPDGDAGDEMIKTLAERLIRVDLFSDAARLLTHQFRFRAEGDAKIDLGIRLAALHLTDNKPEQVLKTLSQIVRPDAASESGKQFRLTMAGAHFALGRHDEALSAVEELNDAAALTMRASIQWAKGRWADVANTMSARIKLGQPDLAVGEPQDSDTMPMDTDGVPRQQDAPLTVNSPDQAKDILKLAIALSLSGQNDALRAVREKYLEAMRKTTEGKAFLAVTSRSEASAGAIRDRLKDMEQLVDFRGLYGPKSAAAAENGT